MGGDQLFVSKRAYGAIVRRLAGPEEEADDLGDQGDVGADDADGES